MLNLRAGRGSTEGVPGLLVLTRRSNQSIMIGHDIVVTVLEVRGEQVRIGIKAPREVEVHREEVFDALHESKAPPTS